MKPIQNQPINRLHLEVVALDGGMQSSSTCACGWHCTPCVCAVDEAAQPSGVCGVMCTICACAVDDE